MRRTVATFVLVGTLVCAGCDQAGQNHSDDPEVAGPTQAIPDFVGFELGSPAPSIRECGKDEYGSRLSDGENVCWWTPEQENPNSSSAGMPDGHYMLEFPLHMIPNGINSSGSMIIINNAVQRIQLRSSGLVAQADLLALLKSKYGEPDGFERKTMTTRGGERIASYSATWLYTDGTIWTEGVSYSVGEGFVRASTYEADAWVKRGFGKNADSF